MKKKKSAVLVLALLALVSLATVGCIAKREENKKIETSTQEVEQKVEETVKEPEKTVEIVLYFSDENAEKLMQEKRMVNYETYKQNPQKVIVEELIKGPLDSKLYAVIPNETKLLSVEVKDRKAIVDLSKEFVDNHNGGSTGEALTVYGIVNSLTELKDIDSVEFKVEGEIKEDFKGHMIFNEPFERNEEIIG